MKNINLPLRLWPGQQSTGSNSKKTRTGIAWLFSFLGLLTTIMAGTATAQNYTFEKDYDVNNTFFPSTASYTMELITSITQDKLSPDDYYYAGIAGKNSSAGNSFCGVVGKINKQGVSVWTRQQKDLNGLYFDIKAYYNSSFAFSGLVVAGGGGISTFGLGFDLLTISGSGTTTGYKRYNANGRARKVQASLFSGSPDGFIAAGKANYNGGNHIAIVKTLPDLTLQWDKLLNNPGTVNAEAFSVGVSYADDYFLTGHSGANMFAARIDYYSGALQFEKLYSLSNKLMVGKDIIEVTNPGTGIEHYVVGQTETSSGTGDDIFIMRLDQYGTIISSVYLDLPLSAESASGLVRLPTGEFVISGTSNDVPVLIKVNAALTTILFSKKYTNTIYASSLTRTNDQGFILGGHSNFPGNTQHFSAIKTDANGFTGCESNFAITLSNFACTTATANFTVTNNTMTANNVTGIPNNTLTVTTAGHCQNVLSTNPINGSLCVGSALNVGFTTNIAFSTGDILTVEISSPGGIGPWTPIGSITVGPGYSGTTTGIIPSTLPGTSSSNVKIRVTANNQTVIGTDNGSFLNINALPVVSLSGLTPAMICFTPGMSAVTLNGAFPPGGVYTIAGVPGNSFTPPGPGTYPISYNYADPAGCSNSALTNMNVYSAPIVTLGSFPTVCTVSSPYPLSGGVPAGGTYSGTGVTNGFFDPTDPGVIIGLNYITYTYTDINGCPGSATSPINVKAGTGPVVTAGSFGPYCPGTGHSLSGGTPANGTYYGTNVTNGNFYAPASGNHTVYYKYTNAIGCTNAAPTVIAVHTVTPPTISGIPTGGICNGSSYISLTGSPSGGTFSGNGMFLNDFDPFYLNPGTYPVTYTYTDGNGCNVPSTSNITVHPMPATDFSVADACYTPSGVQFTNNSTIPAPGTMTYLWDFDHASQTSTATNPNYAYPSVTWTAPDYFDEYDVTLTVTSDKNCSTPYQKTVKVYHLPPSPTVKTPPTGCTNRSTLLEVDADPDIEFRWYETSTSTTVLGTGDSYTTPPLSGTTTFYVQSFSKTPGACSSASARQPVTVTSFNLPPPAPSASLTLTSQASICPGGTTTMVYTHSGPGGPYSLGWNMNGSPIGTSATPFTYFADPGITVNTNQIFTVTVTEPGTGCKSVSGPVSVTVMPPLVNATGGTVYMCPGGSYNFTTPSPSQTYDWYFDDPNYSNGFALLCSNCPTLNATLEGDYYYDATSSLGCTRSSGIFTLAVAIPKINHPNPPPAWTTSGGTVLLQAAQYPGITYTKYTWYLNGVSASTCATCSTFTTGHPGHYLLEVEGPCGTQYSQDVELIVTCYNNNYNQTYANGYTFNTNTTINAGTAYTFGGTITVSPGVILTLNSVDIEMVACSEIIVEAGGALVLNHVGLSGCSQWKGITVKASGPSNRGVVNISNFSIIQGALIGVYSPDGGQVIIENSTFINNATHVAMFNFAGNAHNSEIKNNIFGYIRSLSNTCSSPAPTFSKPSIGKLIYLEDVKEVLLKGNDFEGHKSFVTYVDKTAIHLKNTSDVKIESNDFTGELTNAIDDELSNILTIGGPNSSFVNTFDGNIKIGVNAENSIGMRMMNNVFGNPTNSNLKDGAVLRNLVNLNAERNDFYNLINGIQLYSPNTLQPQSIIQRNLFSHCATGLVIAPDEHPEFSAQGGNSSTHTQAVQIFCNKFFVNRIGIMGSGVVPVQGTSTNESANNFTYYDIFNNPISNIEWDVIWDANGVSFYHYFSTTPPVYFDINANTLNLSKSLNGVTSTGNITTTSTTFPEACRTMWKTEPVTTVEEISNAWIAKVYPNPSGGELNISFKADAGEKYNVTMFDMLGRRIINESITGQQGENVFTINNPALKKGIYILHLNSDKHSANFRVIMNTSNKE
jgi:hypothetical protein